MGLGPGTERDPLREVIVLRQRVAALEEANKDLQADFDALVVVVGEMLASLGGTSRTDTIAALEQRLKTR